ncbi:MAG: SdpI family protein [Phycisphaerales bacterium]|nr:SdpI family protein [Phycisphaerales bacterium]
MGIHLLLIGSSLLVILVGVPMALGKVPPNRIYGVRLPITLRSRAAWDAANRHYGWWLVASGLMSLPISVGMLLLRSGEGAVVLYGVVMSVPLIVGIVPMMRSADRAERAESASEGADDADSNDAGARSIPDHFK